MPTVIIFILALLLFGPKKLPVLARELGKWIGEFRRASNEFKMQMEEELRISEQAERQKKIAAMEAAAPIAPALEGIPEPNQSIRTSRPPSNPKRPTPTPKLDFVEPGTHRHRARCPSPPPASSASCPRQPACPSREHASATTTLGASASNPSPTSKLRRTCDDPTPETRNAWLN